MDLAKRISNLKDKIATAKAEKKLAQKKIEEIHEKLKEKGIKPEELEDTIKKKKSQINKIETEIEQLVKDAEKVLNNE